MFALNEEKLQSKILKTTGRKDETREQLAPKTIIYSLICQKLLDNKNYFTAKLLQYNIDFALDQSKLPKLKNTRIRIQ